jgi:hypothetical protein
MTLRDDDLRGHWRRRTDAAPGDRSSCLTEEEWQRLASNEVDATERARLAQHIARCADCADEYRIVHSLRPWADDADRVLVRGEHAARLRVTSWWRARRRAVLVAAAAVIVIVAQAGAIYYLWAGAGQQSARFEAQLADHAQSLSSAQAAITALEAELRTRPVPRGDMKALQDQVAELSSPQIGVPIVDLDPQESAAVRGERQAQVVTASADARSVALILNFAPLPSRVLLEIGIADDNGRTLWTGRAARDAQAATLNLTLPTRAYPPGLYTIRLFDVTGGRKTVATYRVTIQ